MWTREFRWRNKPVSARMAQDHYLILGVEPSADITIIKRRYRQLVRANHPDIAPDRDSAHEKMLQINAAWTVLSDPAERARYDRGRRDPTGRGEAGAADGPVVTRKQTGADEYLKNAAERARTAGRGAGSAQRQAPRASRNAARGSSQTRTRLLTMVFEAAELYFFQGRAEEAIEICERVMKADPSNAEAPALLGDIYSEQGRKDVAQKMYQLAVNNQPQNALYKQKLDALQGNDGAPTARTAGAARTAGSASRASSARATARQAGAARPGGPASSPRSSQYRASVVRNQQMRSNAGMAMAAGAFLCLAIGAFAIDPAAIEIPMVPDVDLIGGALPLFTALGALLLGISMPLMGFVGLAGMLRPNQPKWLGWPLYALLLVLAVVWFPLALVFALTITLASKNVDRSWIVLGFTALVWSCTLALNLTNALPDTEVPGVLLNSALYWSGRLVYPPLVLGWALGSAAARR